MGVGGVLMGSRINKPSSGSVAVGQPPHPSAAASFSDSAVWDFYPPGGLQTRSSLALLSHSHAGEASLLSAGQAPASRKKGFSFGKSTFATGAIDTVTGTTNADLLYRSVQLDDGSQLIYATSKVVRDLPRGSAEVHAFGTDRLHTDDTLSVVANVTSPIRPSYTGGFNLDPAESVSAHAAELASPVTFQRVTETVDATGLRPLTAPGRALPGPTSAPLTSQPHNSPFKPPVVLKSRHSHSYNSLSPPKSSPSATGLSVRASEKLAVAVETVGVGAATEAYRRLKKKQSEKNRKDDALGTKRMGLAKVGLDASLVESIGTTFAP
jgi:hypothetical protein